MSVLSVLNRLNGFSNRSELGLHFMGALESELGNTDTVGMIPIALVSRLHSVVGVEHCFLRHTFGEDFLWPFRKRHAR